MTHHATSWDADACIDQLVAARLAEPPAALKMSGTALYLLIDPFLGDPVLSAPLEEGLSDQAINGTREKAWQRPTFNLHFPSGLPIDTALAPYLVELTGVNDPWLDASVQWAIQETAQTWNTEETSAVPHRVGGWLQSAAGGSALAEHLTQLLRLRTQQPTQARYLRLADRRVLGLATHVLGEPAMAASLPLVQHWHWLDAHAAWVSLKGQHPTAHADNQPSLSPAQPLLAFNTQEWRIMSHGPSIHHQMALSIADELTRGDCATPLHWQSISSSQWQASCEAALAMTPRR